MKKRTIFNNAKIVLADRIMEEQKIDVDAVSGATNSSVVIKKAVENAYLVYKISLYMR